MTPLNGIRVLDLTHAHAGPLCTLYLAGMGAEVIKIEPLQGEMNRLFPPLVKGQSPYFQFLNRGKKGVTLNLKDPRGIQIFKSLVLLSDIVVENFSPGAMDRLGLGWEELHKLNPRIIYCSISGFGYYGPWKDRKSFDPIAQATSGYSEVAREEINPKGPPVFGPEAIGDTIPGLTAIIGILAALNQRQITSEGQRIDIAQMDAMIATMQSFSFHTFANTTYHGQVSRVNIAGLHHVKDGWVVFSLTAGRIMDSFMAMLGVEEEPTREQVANWCFGKTRDEVVEILNKIGVPVGPVLKLDEVLACDHAKARDMFVKVEHPVLGSFIEPGFPIKSLSWVGDVSVPAPLLGQHNEEVLHNLLGLSESDIDILLKEGVI